MPSESQPPNVVGANAREASYAAYFGEASCAQCDHPLRGLVHDGVCPECGLSVAASLEHDEAQRPDARVRKLRLFAMVACAAMIFVVIPLLNLAGVMADTEVNRLSRYLCFAIAALGIDLIWGYTGALSLCQALFFCMGGYAMAMHLSLPSGGGDVREEYNNIPQFFFFNSIESLPGWWEPFASMPFALAFAIFLPAITASIFGFFIFRSRVRGVYFAIITQAVALAAFRSVSRNEMLLGGTNGLTNFYKPLNRERAWILGLYMLTAAVLLLSVLVCRYVVRSPLGKLLVAVRDNERRLNFAGYRPEYFKMFAFAFAAVLGAIGGILYAPQNGIITPNIMRVEDSIILVVCVALGGRGYLWGALAGTIVYWISFSTLTSDLPTYWPIMFGLIVIAVVVFLPNGLVGLWTNVEDRLRRDADRKAVLLTAMPLIGIALFTGAEALGKMPGFLDQKWFGVHGKYMLLGLLLLIGGVLPWFSRLQTARQKREGGSGQLALSGGAKSP